MTVVEKIEALFAGLDQNEVFGLPPARRERFYRLCQHWADLSEPAGVLSTEEIMARAQRQLDRDRAQEEAEAAERRPRSGVLAALARGDRAHGL
jgi:hypothetical protein